MREMLPIEHITMPTPDSALTCSDRNGTYELYAHYQRETGPNYPMELVHLQLGKAATIESELDFSDIQHPRQVLAFADSFSEQAALMSGLTIPSTSFIARICNNAKHRDGERTDSRSRRIEIAARVLWTVGIIGPIAIRELDLKLNDQNIGTAVPQNQYMVTAGRVVSLPQTNAEKYAGMTLHKMRRVIPDEGLRRVTYGLTHSSKDDPDTYLERLVRIA